MREKKRNSVSKAGGNAKRQAIASTQKQAAAPGIETSVGAGHPSAETLLRTALLGSAQGVATAFARSKCDGMKAMVTMLADMDLSWVGKSQTPYAGEEGVTQMATDLYDIVKFRSGKSSDQMEQIKQRAQKRSPGSRRASGGEASGGSADETDPLLIINAMGRIGLHLQFLKAGAADEFMADHLKNQEPGPVQDKLEASEAKNKQLADALVTERKEHAKLKQVALETARFMMTKHDDLCKAADPTKPTAKKK